MFTVENYFNFCGHKIKFNPFMLVGFFYLNSSDQSISSLRGVWSVFIITMFY